MYDEKYGVSLLCVLVFCDLFLLDYVNGMVNWLMWFNFYKLMLWVCVYYQRDFVKYKYEEEDFSDMWY